MPDLNHPLAVCLKILEGFGEIGQSVWELGRWYVGELQDDIYKKNKNTKSQAERLVYLKKAITHLKSKTEEKGYWREIPVDFRTFVESPKYLNKPGTLWPKVIENGEEINSGRYSECVLTGAIGVAKTTLALYTQAYQIYVLSCMLDPHEVFDLDPSSEILTVFQSVNKNTANDIDYRRLRDMIANGPYFTERFPFQKDRESEMRFPRNIILKPVAGHDQAAIGANVIGGILDEINFMAVVENSKMSNDGGTYDQATQNYNAIARRRSSRFMRHGTLPGMLCLVSSRKYPGQFTDKKEEEAKSNPRIFVYDKRIWELRPERFAMGTGVLSNTLIEQYGPNCPLTFEVFVGDATRKPYILSPGQTLAPEDQRLVMTIPIEYKQDFEEDMLSNLRDVAGVATQAMHPYMMNTDAITASFGKVKSILSRDDCDFISTSVQIYPRRIVNPTMPRFVHIDLAITRDAAGVAIGHVPGFMQVRRGDMIENLPIIRFDALLRVLPPRGGEISFADVRRLIYAARDKAGIPIKWVTADNVMMSKDTLQQLSQQHFMVGYQSMDTDTVAYDVLRQAIYDARVLAPDMPVAQRELTRLEVIPKDQTIDHPPKGSKDVADAMAGVAYGLTMRREIWNAHGVSLTNIPASIRNARQPKDGIENQSYRQLLQNERGMRRREERIQEEARNVGEIPLLVGDGPSGLRRYAR